MANRILVEKEIKAYCCLNNISDIEGFITQCLVIGFNTFKYGTSPSDNIKRENNLVDTNTLIITRNKKVEIREEPKPEENKIEIKRKKVKIINND